MTPPDDLTKRALIVADQSVELFDLTDFLNKAGWEVIESAHDATTAGQMLRTAEPPYRLVIIAVPHSDPDTISILRQALASGSRVIAIDGARMTQRDDLVLTVLRPYADDDLETALQTLGLVDT
ncbi:MAG: hypothetical protein AB3N11_13455 [Arenibacterium sp.]